MAKKEDEQKVEVKASLLDKVLAKLGIKSIEEVAMGMDLSTADGNTLTVEREEGEPQVGDKASPDGTFVMKPGTSLVTSNADLQSLTTYMTKRGYHQYQLNMIEAARSGTLDMLSAINLMMEENLIK